MGTRLAATAATEQETAAAATAAMAPKPAAPPRSEETPPAALAAWDPARATVVTAATARSSGGGAAGGNGSATGGDGGNIPGDGTGNPGAAGEGISGGDGGNVNNTPGKAGFKVTAIVDDTKAGTTVTAPEKDLADAVITQEDIDNNRNVKVELIVEKRDDQPDKTLVEQTLGGTKADTIGVYFEITLEKTVTESGTTKPTETITESHQPIEITITIPDDMRGGSNYVVIRVHDGSAVALPTTQSENKLIFQTDKFSTYAIAYTPGGTTPPAPPHGGGSPWEQWRLFPG